MLVGPVVADALEPAERQRVADETRTILERLGARPNLAQLEALLARVPVAEPLPSAARSDAAVDEVPSG